MRSNLGVLRRFILAVEKRAIGEISPIADFSPGIIHSQQ